MDEFVAEWTGDVNWDDVESAPTKDSFAQESPAQMNLKDEINMRRNLTPQEVFDADVDLLERAIRILPKYDALSIRAEIHSMDLSVPKESFDFTQVQEAYARLNAYRYRVVALLDTVSQHYHLYSSSYKTMAELAIRLSMSGTGQVNKANGLNVVEPIRKAMLGPQQMLDTLKEWRDQIDSGLTTLARLLREHEALSKMHQGHIADGQYYLSQRHNNDSDSSLFLKTRSLRNQNGIMDHQIPPDPVADMSEDTE